MFENVSINGVCVSLCGGQVMVRSWTLTQAHFYQVALKEHKEASMQEQMQILSIMQRGYHAITLD